MQFQVWVVVLQMQTPEPPVALHFARTVLWQGVPSMVPHQYGSEAFTREVAPTQDSARTPARAAKRRDFFIIDLRIEKRAGVFRPTEDVAGRKPFHHVPYFSGVETSERRAAPAGKGLV